MRRIWNDEVLSWDQVEIDIHNYDLVKTWYSIITAYLIIIITLYHFAWLFFMIQKWASIQIW